MFKLLDFNNQEILFKNLDNKALWCAYGERQEQAFVSLFNKLKEEVMAVWEKNIIYILMKNNYGWGKNNPLLLNNYNNLG